MLRSGRKFLRLAGELSDNSNSLKSVPSCIRRVEYSSESDARKTCLYDFHVKNGGKIVDFAGWLLPVQYKEAIAVSHQHTRTYASLFDVGHMLQTRVWGRDSGEFLESLTTADLKSLKPGSAALTVFTNDNGGILDDLIITKDGEDRYFVVSNAGRREQDMELLNQRHDEFNKRGKKVQMQYLDPLEQGLLALQGPTAAKVLGPLVKIDLKKLFFMNSVETQISNRNVRITRCGYTGEDGFEISVAAEDARSVAEMILKTDNVRLAGLGPRDSLRLEAGLCLYGHDINEETTPVEAGLTWLIAKRRRAERNFAGAERILSQIKLGPRRKRVGLTLGQGPPARENAAILTPEGEKVGTVTSGGPSPTLGKPIAMGYVPTDLAQNGGGVLVEVRGKTYRAITYEAFLEIGGPGGTKAITTRAHPIVMKLFHQNSFIWSPLTITVPTSFLHHPLVIKLFHLNSFIRSPVTGETGIHFMLRRPLEASPLTSAYKHSGYSLLVTAAVLISIGSSKIFNKTTGFMFPRKKTEEGESWSKFPQ